MSIDKLVVTIIGVLGIGFVYWFFLGKKEKEVKASGSVDITVDGGYTPNIITVPRGKTTIINFTRKDENDCLSEVVLGDFKIKRDLPLGEKVTVEINPQKTGEYTYSCGMNMYRGKIIVK
ncbi:MAG TPA: copper-binding protein [Candidatus Blackburnbacteria bacterium]|nr:copper-binding protein [Candidatus Blackburnbacteria bacterium]